MELAHLKLLSLHGMLLVVTGLCLPATGQTQEAGPHVGYAYPAGGRAGTTFEVVLGGQYLNGSRSVIVSGQGVDATVLGYCKPPNRGQANKIRQKLREMWTAEQKKRAKEGKDGAKGRPRGPRTYPISKLPPETWKKLAASVRLNNCTLQEFIDWQKNFRDPKRQPNAQLEESVRISVKIQKDAEPGRRELRLITARGLTPPIFFEVGTLPEHSEIEPNDRTPDASIENQLPILINGQIMPGEVDRFAFQAKKRSRIVASVSARHLVPYLADAVPGWFQATIAIYDESGRRIEYVDDYKFHPDPVLSFEVPQDGRYILEIKDSIYRGREDFVYRLSLGEIPFATSAWPMGARTGTKTRIRLKGWNLPKAQVTVAPVEGPRRIESIHSARGRSVSNSLPLAVDVLEEQFEDEPNQEFQEAQEVRIPILINGRIREPGDQDTFRFESEAGERWCFEVLARRLGSPLDSLLQVFDAKGHELAKSDDWRDEEAGLTTHHADSRILFDAKTAGTYVVRISDTQHKGSQEHSYRLRMTRQHPDFALRVVPASLTLRAGTNTPITVHALRKDGFDGDIRLELLGAPEGFHLDGAIIPSGQDKIRLTISTPSGATRKPFRLHMAGAATIGGREIQRPAVAAEDQMQAFLWRHLVPSEDLWVQVQGRGRARGQPGVRLLTQGATRIQQGTSTWISFSAPPQLPWSRIHFELQDPPAGFKVGKTDAKTRGLFRVEILTDKTVVLGQRGNLVLQAFLVNTPPKDKKGKARGRTRRIPMGFLPAIAYVTHGRTLSF